MRAPDIGSYTEAEFFAVVFGLSMAFSWLVVAALGGAL